jgi:flagellin-like protein
MKRSVRNKKALSPVLSSVLMILIVVIGMSLLFAFFVNYATDFQRGSGSSVLELIVVEDACFKNSTSSPSPSIELNVYNVGKVDSNITSIYVNDIRTPDPQVNSVYFHGKPVPGSPKIIPANGHANVTVPYPQGWKSHLVYDIKIVTARGSSFEGSYVSPG